MQLKCDTVRPIPEHRSHCRAAVPYSPPATESTTLRCMSDQEFHATMRTRIKDCLLHALVARLTYVICEMISLVPSWRAANRKSAQALFDYMVRATSAAGRWGRDGSGQRTEASARG